MLDQIMAPFIDFVWDIISIRFIDKNTSQEEIRKKVSESKEHLNEFLAGVELSEMGNDLVYAMIKQLVSPINLTVEHYLENKTETDLIKLLTKPVEEVEEDVPTLEDLEELVSGIKTHVDSAAKYFEKSKLGMSGLHFLWMYKDIERTEEAAKEAEEAIDFYCESSKYSDNFAENFLIKSLRESISFQKERASKICNDSYGFRVRHD